MRSSTVNFKKLLINPHIWKGLIGLDYRCPKSLSWLINSNDCHDSFRMLQSYGKLPPTDYFFQNPLDNSGEDEYRILRWSIHIYSEVGSDSEVNIMEIPRQHPCLSTTSSIAKKHHRTHVQNCRHTTISMVPKSEVIFKFW